nr:unnamed protein product [Callosobruchus chinensis]
MCNQKKNLKKTVAAKKVKRKVFRSDAANHSDSDSDEMTNNRWVQCTVCKRWAHRSCAGEEEEDDEVVHICEFCKS